MPLVTDATNNDLTYKLIGLEIMQSGSRMTVRE